MENAVVSNKLVPLFGAVRAVAEDKGWLIISSHQFRGHLPLIVQIKGDVIANSNGNSQLMPIAPRTPDVELFAVANLEGGFSAAVDCLRVCSTEGVVAEDAGEIVVCSTSVFSNSCSFSAGPVVVITVLAAAVVTLEVVSIVDLLAAYNNFLGTNSECITNAIAISVDMPSSNSDANEELIMGCQFC